MVPRYRKMILLAVVLLLTLVLTINGWNMYKLPQRVAQWRAQLADEYPAQRIAAAQSILRVSHEDAQARLVLAAAYLDSLRFGPSRQTLQPLLAIDGPSRMHAQLAMTESYLIEAAFQAADATAASADLVAERVESLLGEAVLLHKSLAANPEAGASPLLIEARILDIRAMIMQARLRSLDIEFSKASAIDAEAQVHSVGVQLAEWRGQLAILNQRIEAVCRQALEQYPHDPRPHALMVRRWIRQGDHAKVHRSLEILANHPGPLERSIVGQVVISFFDLEWTVGRVITPTDLEMVRQLLEHPSLTGVRNIDFRLAQTELSLRQADWDTALEQAMQTMRIFVGHPRAVCQYDMALAQLGRRSEAIRSLAVLNEKIRSPYTRYMLGRIYLLDQQPNMAMEQFRQALDIQSDLAGPRIAIVQTMLDQGYIREAANDIRWLYRRMSDHPLAVQAYIRLLVEQMDLENLASLILQQGDPAGNAQGWRSAAIVTSLLVDDLPQAQVLAREQLLDNPIDPLAHLTLVLAPDKHGARFQLSGMLATVLLDLMDADPMLRLGTPQRLAGMNHLKRTTITSRHNPDTDILSLAIDPNLPRPTAGDADLPVVEAIDLDPLSLGRFVTPSYRTALDLAEAALDRWPDQEMLRKHALVLSLFCDDAPSRNAHWQVLYSHHPEAYWLNHPLQAVDAFARMDWQALADQLSRWRAEDVTYPSVLRIWLDLSLLASTPAHASGLRPALRKALHDQPWCEPLLLTPLRETLARRELEMTFGMMQDARQITPQMSLLTGARLGLATQRLQDASHDLEMLLAKEGTASELRMIAADPSIKVLLSLGRPEQAAGLLERLGLSCSYRRHAMHLAAADLLHQLGRTSTAISILTATAAESQISPRWLDAALQRIVALLPPERSVRLLENMQQIQPGQWIVRVHLAMAQIRNHELDAALETLAYLERVAPRLPRVAAVRIQVSIAQNNLEKARQLLTEIQQQGGRSGRDAAQWLAELAASSDIPASSPALTGHQAFRDP